MSNIRPLFRITHNIIGLILRLLSIGMTIVYLLAVLAPYIPPYYSTVPAILGLFFPIIFVLQLSVLLFWLLCWRIREVLILLGIFLLSLGGITSYFPINRASTVESLPEGSIKVLSYNVCAFGFLPHTPSKPNPILLYIKNSDADIVCLQEAALASSPNYGVTKEALHQYLKEDYPYIHIKRAQPRGSTLILLSRFPITASEVLPINSVANGGIAYTLEVNGKELLLTNLHLESFRLHRSDGEEYIKLIRDGDTFGFRDAMQAKIGPTFLAHNLQANLIRTYQEQHSTDNAIICGDFNDTALSYAHHKIGQGMQDAYIESGNGFGFSFDTGVFVVRIDHILAGKAWMPKACYVDREVKYSDHYPIQTYLIPQSK